MRVLLTVLACFAVLGALFVVTAWRWDQASDTAALVAGAFVAVFALGAGALRRFADG